MKQIEKEALLEGVKELIRTVILGMVIPVGAVLIVIKAGINVDLGTFLIPWNIAGAILASGFIGSLQTAIPSAVDKWLHKSDVKSPLDLRGLDTIIQK